MTLPNCTIYGCHEPRMTDSFYCEKHANGEGLDFDIKGPSAPSSDVGMGQGLRLYTTTERHVKISIEQTAKGARVSVTYDRDDHDLEQAINDSIKAYKATLETLKNNGLKVDES